MSQADFLPMFPSPNMGLTECVVRELSEEIDLPSEDRHRLSTGDGLDCIGVLNDDSSAVGRRHFAFVFRYEVSTHPQWIEPIRGEKSITQLKWLNRHSDPIPIWEFEYWSQLVLRRFFPSVVTTQQSYKVVRRKPLTPPHLLCLIGEVGSGKSKTKEVLNTQFNYREVNSGRVLANLLKIPSVPDTPREDFQAKAWEFITSGDGPGRLAKAIARHVTELGHERVLIDGIRQRATLEELRRHCENRRLGILYVFTPPDMAYDFYRRRERQGITFEDYLAIRNADVETEVPGMIAIADGVLYNWTGHAFHVATIRSMFEELGIQ